MAGVLIPSLSPNLISFCQTSSHRRRNHQILINSSSSSSSTKRKISPSSAAASDNRKCLLPKISYMRTGSSGSSEKNITRARRSVIAAACSSFTTQIQSSSSSSSTKHEFDVVVVGAGIIGLAITRQFLLETDLSVAIVDAAVPCAGASGAGQGNVFMINKRPDDIQWELLLRSKEHWEALASSLQDRGINPTNALGFQKNGSMVIGTTSEESAMLKERVEILNEAGLRAEYLSVSNVRSKEPAIELKGEGGAAFLANDCQLDALRSAAFIEKENRDFASKGRYAEFYHDPVISLLRSGGGGEVEGVETSKNTIYCKKAVVIAAGSWSGTLMQSLLVESNILVDVPVKPRKGYLLVLENFDLFPVNHGLMEVDYLNHQLSGSNNTSTASESDSHDPTLSISMTAAKDVMGNLLLGSSRQFAGFNTDIDGSIIHAIWNRNADFFPALREIDLVELSKRKKIRVGLRPYMPDGKPLIGPVPSVPNLILAAGHEGEGLTMAWGTAEMVVDMVLGNEPKVDPTPFYVEGRCQLKHEK